MAFSDFLIRIGLDSSKFSAGSRKMGQDTSQVRQSIATLNATIGEQVKRMNEMVRAGQMGTKEFTQLNAAIRKNEGALRTLGRQLDGTGAKMKGLDMSQIGGALTGGIIGGGVAGAAMMGAQKLQQVFSETLQVTVSFDDAIRKVGATSGATGKQMEDLRNAAIDMGSKTRFTASQAAEALNYMALAGWNTEKSISALPGVLNLAAAAGTDLGMTSDILTDTMSAFGMEAKESTKVADVFAQVQSKANTTVEMLGEAMKYAAPQFASAGQSIETTSTIIGLLANQGIKASMAGTAMNAMLKDLKTQSDNGVLSFGKMNIQLYDQQGNMRDLIDIIRDMRSGVQGLTQQQRDAITGGLFEERSIKAVNILLNSTDEVINNLSRDVQTATGRSQEMADQMEGGVGGALRKMQSAWEGLQLTITKNATFAQIWYDGWAAVFVGLTDTINREKSKWDYIFLAFKIGPLDAMKFREQTKGIEDFGEAYKKAVDGEPAGKLLDQMTRLTWITEGQALAFEKRNAAAGKMLAPRTVDVGGEAVNLNTIKGLQEYINLKKEERENVQMNSSRYKDLTDEIGKYEKILKQATETTNGSSKATKTSTEIYAELQKEIASSARFHVIMGDEVGALADKYSLLEKAISAAWKAGSKDAEDVVRRLKKQQEEMTAGRMVPEVGMLPKLGAQPVQSLTAKVGFELPTIDAEKILAPLRKSFNDQMQKANLLQKAFGDVDMVATEMQSLGQLIAEGLEAGLDSEKLQVYIDKWKELSEGQKLAAAVTGQFASEAAAAFEAIGSGSATAVEGLQAVGKAALMAALDYLKGKLLESTGDLMKWAGKLGPLGIPLVGAGIGALFGLVRGALSRTKSVKLAEGGIISGRTMAEVGEYPGAAFNPEVVAPLDKLQAMLDVGGATHVTGTFRVQGSDLVLALDNAQRKMNQFRV